MNTQPTIDKKKITEEIREYHRNAFDRLGANRMDFYPKMAFMMSGDKRVIGVYTSELEKEVFYTELIDRSFSPLDPIKRTLYCIRKRPDYKNVYASIGPDKYAIPVESLEEVKIPPLPAMSWLNQDLPKIPNETADENISKMTIRDFAAIVQWKPISQKMWLNELISTTTSK